MKPACLLFFVFTLAVFLLQSCYPKSSYYRRQEGYVCMGDTTSSDALNVKGKVNFKSTGADGMPYYFSISDTVPTMSFNMPHVLLSQGDPLNLHSIFILANYSKIGADTLNAVMGIVNTSGKTNNVLKATPYEIGIQTTLADDYTGGAYYGFTKKGLIFKVGDGKSFDQTYIISNRKGSPGQVLTLNASGDTATWADAPSVPAIIQKYFAPANGQAIAVEKGAYNIINPPASLPALTINLPVSPADNDWFEITFAQPVKVVAYTGGKVAGNAIRTATMNNYYKKFVYRKADLTWY